MLATSRMSRFMRWMRAVLWRRLRAVALAKSLSGRLTAFQIPHPCVRLRHILAFSLRPILIHSGRSGAAAVEQAEALAVAAAAEVRVEEAQEGAPVAEGVALEAEVRVEAREGEGAVKAALAVALAVALAAEEAALVAREGAHAVAVTILPRISAIRPSTSRAQSFRHFLLLLPPTSKSLRRWRRARAVSRFSTPTTFWTDSIASGESRTNSTF